ncbi:transcriptional repressor [Mycobacterium phage Firehouse51]|uniref:Immunity repressor n=1 Tax=Mycobacterium phage Firehouse51 TaxID=2776877 RepID=A0A7M1CKZ3_9CAUD|nr:transcriptional repressor [Mycobacterium phage Firehouse51]QOP65006.1 immunity repressor [Mycobacterium phage Firehouse51]
MRQQCVYAADMPNEELMKWIDKRIADANTTAASIADKAGINKSTITKWRGGSQPRPGDLRMVANALGAPVLEAFLVAGYLKPGDTRKVVQVDRPLDQRSDEELVAEVNRRLKEARNVMETAQTTRTPRETHQDQEEALGARPGEPPQPSQPRASETGPAIHAHIARSVRARQRRKD